MRRELIIAIIALAALLGSYVAIRAQGPPGGAAAAARACGVQVAALE